jgi:transcriptional regulator GlxA family with amidase domain
MPKTRNAARRKNRVAERVPALERGDEQLDVTVVLLEAGYMSTAIAPIEIFHSAGTIWNWLQGTPQKPRFRVKIASIDGGEVTALCSLGLKPNCSIHDIDKTDIIVLPASGWDVRDRIAKHTALLPWLKKWHSRGAYIAGVCTGVAFLAEAGLLDGREATTHWGVAEILRQSYPKVHWRTDQFVTEDGQLFCSGGVYAAVDISLYLVEKFCGHEIALQVAKALLLSMPRSRQSGYSVVPLSCVHSDAQVGEAEAFLQAHFDSDISVETVADYVGMSPRNFIRRFKAATGRLPGAYIQMLRVSAAREMLEDGATSIQTVSSKIGYEDIAFFRSLFKRHTGMTPAEYRSHFAHMTFRRGDLVGGRPDA